MYLNEFSILIHINSLFSSDAIDARKAWTDRYTHNILWFKTWEFLTHIIRNTFPFILGAGAVWKVLSKLLNKKIMSVDYLSICFLQRMNETWICSQIRNNQEYSTHTLVEVSSTSVIIGGMRTSSTSWIKGIFRPTAMPILRNLARIRSIHSASSIYALKLPLCFPWKKEK